MSTPYYQPLDPESVPDPVTPAASPVPGFSAVTPSGQGTAWYDIQAGNDEASITAAYQGSLAVAGGQEGASTGAGLPDRASPRQMVTETLLSSPQGFSAGGGTSGWDITPGYSGGGGDSGWPNNPQPSILETPIQGQGGYPPNTGTD